MRDASDVPNDESTELPGPIASDHREIPNELDLAGFAVDARHRFVGGAVIDEILGERVAMHRTPAVNHQLEEPIATGRGPAVEQRALGGFRQTEVASAVAE